MNNLQSASLLKYKNYRYLKVSAAMTGAAILVYLFNEPVGGHPFGGTWLGYTLGVVSTLIMFGLMWYGVAKRSITGTPDWSMINEREPDNSHAPRGRFAVKRGLRSRGMLQEWLSGHIYLGVSLLVLATLHTGFHFGWNVHTLAYVLMVLVILSGFYGLSAYLTYPRLITLNMGEDTLDDLLLKIAELDESAAARAMDMSDEINGLVMASCKHTRVGGNIYQQLSGDQRDCPTRYATHQLIKLGEHYTRDDQRKMLRDLYSLLLRKEKLVSRARTEIMLKARLECWLYLHAPLGIALFAALTAHIVSIFFYW
jgi:hypothetical protein